MTRTATPRAQWSDSIQLGYDLVNKGLQADQVVPYLKERKYTVEGLKFDATRVSAFVAGARWVEATLLPMVNDKSTSEAPKEASEPTYTLSDIESMFESGALKYTKSKGLHNPQARKGR